MKKLIQIPLLLALSAPLLSCQSEPKTSKNIQSKRINVFFEEVFQDYLKHSPSLQTRIGIKTDYGKWDDSSEAGRLALYKRQLNYLAQLREFNKDFLNEEAIDSYNLMEQQLMIALEGFKFRHHSFRFNQMWGVHTWIPGFMMNQHKVESLSDARAYISRLKGIKTYLSGILEHTKASEKKAIIPPRFVFKYAIESSANLISGYPFHKSQKQNPLFKDFKQKVSQLKNISDLEKLKLIEEAKAAMINYMGPTYKQVISYLKKLKRKAKYDRGVWSMPDGDKFYAYSLKYHTTTEMTPNEIHELGVKEVKRIHKEIRAIIKNVGFRGSLQSFFAHMKNSSKFYYPNTPEGRQAYLTKSKRIIENMKKRLPELFNVFPKADVVVKAVEPWREKSAGIGFYNRSTPDGKRPGIYYVNLYDLKSVPKYEMEALAYHEGVPGHHMQLALTAEQKNLPSFRKHIISATAYSEGWALYSELIPKEIGLYKDPYSNFGRLSMELWRACRLVVDTGLHAKKWSKAKAISYLNYNNPSNKKANTKAVERYLVLPGQATSYKIGMIKIMQLRDKAKKQLGDKFDIRSFHDEVLKSGSIPLTVLEQNIDRWMAGQETHIGG